MTVGLPEAIETLDARHDRRSFSCGDSELDGYLKRFARQHAAAKVSRTYVAANGATILGYYSLAMSAIRKDQLPVAYQSRFPNYPLPVARLARLAVDQRYQRQGLGELLLADALSRCLRLSEEIGMVGVVVDAKHERARRYYERFEFERFPDSPLTLWLPTAAIARL
ncbi:GNAT family N-acetyltransferase [Methylococcus sp. EFPC2]|uniref:GNAT family N-acetyltransferase n=1 Tax=Methylococcus sp. EFPC2 TaxID=2812648 RepID=UPI0019673749|nr:GNAT family N-acetyltransferase [Methylococcus sp. EFPC2]QSA98121.1 GNAT family N-acetyltransferase [Methylococcus sp. EFPC2]